MVGFLQTYSDILLANGRFSNDDQCPLSLSLGGDPGFDAVLEWIRPEIERVIGLELAPTYSYVRRYAKGDGLPVHRDRRSCEVSLSIALRIPEGSERSPLRLRLPNGDEVGVEMREGDACLYAGTEIEHWREIFQSDGLLQLFLHYITVTGANFPELVFDQRKRLGS